MPYVTTGDNTLCCLWSRKLINALFVVTFSVDSYLSGWPPILTSLFEIMVEKMTLYKGGSQLMIDRSYSNSKLISGDPWRNLKFVSALVSLFWFNSPHILWLLFIMDWIATNPRSNKVLHTKKLSKPLPWCDLEPINEPN